MALQYQEIASSATAGPLLADITASTFFSVIVDRRNIAQLVNEILRQAEQGLPEGERVELRLHGLYEAGGYKPSDLATVVNNEYLRGAIVYPETGEIIEPWPEYPYQIAWADDAAGTLTLRWRKGIAWAWVIIAVIVVGLAIYAVYTMLRQAGWVGSRVVPVPNGGVVRPVQPTIGGIPVTWIIAGAVVLAVGPWALRRAAEFVRAKRELEEAAAE